MDTHCRGALGRATEGRFGQGWGRFGPGGPRQPEKATQQSMFWASRASPRGSGGHQHREGPDGPPQGVFCRSQQAPVARLHLHATRAGCHHATRPERKTRHMRGRAGAATAEGRGSTCPPSSPSLGPPDHSPAPKPGYTPRACIQHSLRQRVEGLEGRPAEAHTQHSMLSAGARAQGLPPCCCANDRPPSALSVYLLPDTAQQRRACAAPTHVCFVLPPCCGLDRPLIRVSPGQHNSSSTHIPSPGLQLAAAAHRGREHLIARWVVR
jgi:hypothetical protein